MSQQASELTHDQLITRAKKLHVDGDHQAAIAAAVIAIAELLSPAPPVHPSEVPF